MIWKGKPACENMSACVTAMLGVSSMMADPASDFINKYELFVDGVAALNSGELKPETMDSVKLVYKEFTKEYKGGGVEDEAWRQGCRWMGERCCGEEEKELNV